MKSEQLNRSSCASSGVLVGSSVGLCVLVDDAVRVGLSVGTGVSVRVAVGVLVGSGVRVSVGVLDAVGAAVSVGLRVAVSLGVSLAVAVAEAVVVRLAVARGVAECDGVALDVLVVDTGVAEGLTVVGVAVPVAVRLARGVGVDTRVESLETAA